MLDLIFQLVLVSQHPYSKKGKKLMNVFFGMPFAISGNCFCVYNKEEYAD